MKQCLVEVNLTLKSHKIATNRAPYNRQRKSALEGSFPSGVLPRAGRSRRGTTTSDILLEIIEALKKSKVEKCPFLTKWFDPLDLSNQKKLLDLGYIYPRGVRGGVALFFFGKSVFLKHPSIHPDKPFADQ